MSNPANLVAGLLDEREAARRTGDEKLVAQIEEQIDAHREALEEFDPSGVDEEGQRKAVAAVRRRLAAFDRGERPEAAGDGEPRVHNAANYMTGLLDERDGALRGQRPTDNIDAEIERVRPHFEQFQPEDDETGDAKRHYAAAKRRLAGLPRASRASKAEQPEDTAGDGEQEKDARKGGARTTKAAAAPRTAAQ